MECVEKYMALYPRDRTTITGGAAAFLILQEEEKQIPLKDVDVNIETVETGKTILDRWMSIVPPSYTFSYDVDLPIEIFTLIDARGEGISIDVFINDRIIDDKNAERIGPFRVVSLEHLVAQYYQELPGRKLDIELINSGTIKWNPQELPLLIDKYQRLFQRLKMLFECLQNRSSD